MPSFSNVCLILSGTSSQDFSSPLGRLAVVDDLAEVDVLDALRDPGGHRAGHEVVVGAQPELEHPGRLALERADLLDRAPGQADLRLRQVRDVVVEAVLVVLGDDLPARDGHADSSGSGCRSSGGCPGAEAREFGSGDAPDREGAAIRRCRIPTCIVGYPRSAVKQPARLRREPRLPGPGRAARALDRRVRRARTPPGHAAARAWSSRRPRASRRPARRSVSGTWTRRGRR